MFVYSSSVLFSPPCLRVCLHVYLPFSAVLSVVVILLLSYSLTLMSTAALLTPLFIGFNDQALMEKS